LQVGEKYTSVAQFKECLTYYALANGFSLWYEKSGEVRVVAKCEQRPPRVSDPKKVDEQTCVRNFNFGALVNYKWIAKIFGDKIRANPDIRLCYIANLVMKKYKCKVSLNQCTNAKMYALIEYEKSIGEHYSMLRFYGKAILDSNPGSTIKLRMIVNPDGKFYFDRFYVCFARLADGWKASCRKITALDGCFFKSPNQELLEEELGCSRGNGLTLMSNQHKGLIKAVKDVMPNVKHMHCARHIYENFKKQYPGLENRQLFWAASKASYPQLFNKITDKIKSTNPNAHKYLIDKNLKFWLRAFFEVDRGCEAIKNGFSECFNNVIVNVRHKPLLTMLEATRVIVLKRMNKMREISRKWNPRVCPNIKKRLEWLKEQQRFWHVIAGGGNLDKERLGSEGFTIDEGKRTCSCKMWHLSGLPYVHATKSMYPTVLQLKPRKIPGRPRKKRIRAISEGGSSTRVSKVGLQGNCSNYKKPGHNKSSCKEPIVEQTPKPKGVVGRPRNKQPLDDFEDVDVVQRGLVRDEGASGTREGAIGSKGRGGRGVGGSGGASGSISRGSGWSGGTSGSRGKGIVGSRGSASGSICRGVGESKRKHVSTAGTQKDKTQAEPQQTQHKPEQTQVEDQVRHIEDQSKIDLTQLEQTQEPT
nr:hypothetical protein [Tanacetum cinerariifolium]